MHLARPEVLEEIGRQLSDDRMIVMLPDPFFGALSVANGSRFLPLEVLDQSNRCCGRSPDCKGNSSH